MTCSGVPLHGAVEIEKTPARHCRQFKLSDGMNWTTAVEKLTGASAAMTVKAAQDAAKAAVLCGEKMVTELLLLKAISELEDGSDERERD